MFDFNNWYSNPSEQLIIAGPCSAESAEQMLSTAKELAEMKQVKLFRAGIWKPRTRPDGFEGAGEDGLKWMKEVKNQTGFALATEVAKPEHVDLALKYEIDVLWIGARTVANPFSVQELAEALRGTKIPILIKNPLSPDLKLWVGAFERFSHAGIEKLVAVHRGFQYFKQSPYRYFPMWEVPIELRRLMPQIPLITDISHICGRRDLLLETAQRALDLESNGLMIESHFNPDAALTDSQQQVKPTDLKMIIENLTFRKKVGTTDFHQKLEILRGEIDKIDNEMIELLSQRFEKVQQIGEIKKNNNITILQLDRWKQLTEDRLAVAKSFGLDENFLLSFFELIHETSIQKQTEILNGKDSQSQ